MDFWQSSDESRFLVLLERWASTWGIPLSKSQAQLLLEQLRLVLKENQKLNLTALTNPYEALYKHIADSMTFYPAYAQASGCYLDMGCGVGYPGLVLEILKPRKGVLLDSVVKKRDAAQRIGIALGITCVTYVAERVEEYAQTHALSYGVVTARAMAALDVLLEYAAPLLPLGGRFITSKGLLGKEEADHGSHVAHLVGMRCVFKRQFELPEMMGTRTLLVYEKVAEPQVVLPRRVGRATKRPLWRLKP